MSESQYTQPPPDYSRPGAKPDQAPLLPDHHGPKAGKQQQQQQGQRVPDAWLDDDDGEQGGSPAGHWQREDKPTVSQSSVEIRNAFIRKVYSILFFQIAFTAVLGGLCRLEQPRHFIDSSPWVILIPLLLALVSLVFLFFKRYSSPANVILLSLFTVFEALAVGALTTMFDTLIVLEAVCLTAFIFLGLTLFTLQTKRDFSGAGTYLYSALWVLILTSVMSAFFPFSTGVDAVFAGFGALLFSFYIIYDTQMIMQRLSPDEWVLANLSLYLDTINLFLNILRLLSDTQDR